MIAKQLNWEPHGGTQKPWGAVGAFGDRYWADDNGLWHTDPANSGPNGVQAEAAQARVDARLIAVLSDQARQALQSAGLIASEAALPGRQ